MALASGWLKNKKNEIADLSEKKRKNRQSAIWSITVSWTWGKYIKIMYHGCFGSSKERDTSRAQVSLHKFCDRTIAPIIEWRRWTDWIHVDQRATMEQKNNISYLQRGETPPDCFVYTDNTDNINGCESSAVEGPSRQSKPMLPTRVTFRIQI